jgi:hypothetical protein
MMKSAAGMYSMFEDERHSFLLRARDCSKLTLPMLIPDEGSTSATKFPVPFQGLGARGVNHLAASLLMSLLPPNQPFFRLMLDQEAVRQIGEGDIKAEIDATLSSIERSVMQEIESLAIRPVVFEALKHLIVGGNALLHLDKDRLRVYHLDQYTVKRDPSGNILHIVIKETVAPIALPEEALAALGEDCDCDSMEETVDIYTCVHASDNDRFEAYQEVGGVILESTRGYYTKSNLPWFALRMNRIDGESYGRGYVEEYLGDLKSLEGLTQAIVEGSAAAAKVLMLVNPNGLTNPESLARSPNGAIVEGVATDVTVLQVPKQADFSIAFQTINSITERLSYAFLLAESTIRNAERVTAEEVRLTTAAVERQLGGIYSILSQEFQLPLIRRLMGVMQKAKRLPKVPEEYVKPLIITGVDALGRGNDLQKLDTFLVGLQQILGPEAVMQYVDVREYLTRRAAALGLDTEGLVKSEEELAQAKQQAMMQNMATQLGPAAINQVGRAVTEGAVDPAALSQVMNQMSGRS